MDEVYLSSPGLSSNYHELIAQLYKTEIEELSSELNKEVIPVLEATLQVTEDCSLRCTYCYQINKSHRSMTFDTAKKFIDYLFSEEYQSNYPSYGIILNFIGGEPLLKIELIHQITEYFLNTALKLNHRWLIHHMFSIGSNGVSYFDDLVQEYLIKYNNKVSFNITIDGNKELHDKCRVFPDGSGSYDISIKSLRHLKNNYNVMISSKLTISPDNLEYLLDAVKNFIDEDYHIIYMNCVFEDVWSIDDARQYYMILKSLADYLLESDWLVDKHNHNYISVFNNRSYSPLPLSDTKNHCGGNGRMIAVNYTGKLYPCIRYMESSLGSDAPPYTIGDLDVGLSGTPEYFSRYNSLINITRLSQSSDKCINCQIASGCSWCSAYNYQYYKVINKRCTTICDMHKAEALANAYLWNKFYLKYNYPQVFHKYIPDEWALSIVDQSEINLLNELEHQCIINHDEVYPSNYSQINQEVQEWTQLGE